MRIQLMNKGVVVAYLPGGMDQKVLKEDKVNPDKTTYEDDVTATILRAKRRLPKVSFDSIAIVDEDALLRKQDKELADMIKADKEVLESDEYIEDQMWRQAEAIEAADRKAAFVKKRRANSKSKGKPEG